MADSESVQRPSDVGRYVRWLEKKFGCGTAQTLRSQFDAAASKALVDVQSSAPWSDIVAGQRDIAERYLIKTGYPLLANSDPPSLVRKTFDSFLLKTYRKNVIDNAKWPDPPEQGWLTPERWLQQVNDVVRSTLVVKYLDGVPFLTESLATICTKHGLLSRADYEARDEGYYARHFYFTFPVEVPKATWDTESISLSVEIQVTTQLQEVIRRLTHENYEVRRVRLKPREVKWQWDYKADEFKPNYLAHILHYVEGMIMEIRDESARNDRGAKHA